VCLKKRKPFRLEDEIVWVADDGSVMTDGGILLKDVTINPINGVATYSEKETKTESSEGSGACTEKQTEDETTPNWETTPSTND
jgi:hypothetical protein